MIFHEMHSEACGLVSATHKYHNIFMTEKPFGKSSLAPFISSCVWWINQRGNTSAPCILVVSYPLTSLARQYHYLISVNMSFYFIGNFKRSRFYSFGILKSNMKRFSVYCYDKFHYQDPLHSRGMERISSCVAVVWKEYKWIMQKKRLKRRLRERETPPPSLTHTDTHTFEMHGEGIVYNVWCKKRM